MRININKFLVLLLLSVMYSASSQEMTKLSSFEGRNFYVAFMQNELVFDGITDPINTLDLFISASMDAKVVVQGPNKNDTLFVVRGTMRRVGFDRKALLNVSETVSDRAIHISSDVPITVYGMNSIYTTSDMFSAIPVINWGQEYVIMSYSNDYYRGESTEQSAKPRKSEFCVIAANDETVVTITPKTETNFGRKPDKAFSITLNKGESYLVQSAEVQTGGDLSGTLVSANKPIGVISGHVRTAIYQNLDVAFTSKNHLAEMLAPTNTWGKNYITLAYEFTTQKNATLFRATSLTPNTMISIQTNSGKLYSYEITNSRDVIDIDNLNEPAVWQSTSPIQILQYMRHDGGSNENTKYDPSMCGVPPVEQFVPRILFQVPANAQQIPNQFIAHTAMLIVEQSALYNIKSDGNLLFESTNIRSNKILNTPYYWVRVPLSSGTHSIVADSGKFSGVLCGNGDADSYSVVLGSSLLPLNMIDTTAPIVQMDTTCGEINGYFYEAKDTINNSGLDFAHVESSYTINYVYELNIPNDTSSYYTFSANVIDQNREAIIEMYCRDRAGNLVRVSHHYYPLIADYSHKKLNVGIVDWKASVCEDLWLQNNSKVPYQLIDIHSNNPKVKVLPSKVLPLKLNPGERLNYKVCVEPNSDFSDINAEIDVIFECDKKYTFPVTAQVTATELLAEGYVFGKVYVSNDSCANIVLTNSGKTDIVIQGFDFIQNSGQFQYDLTGIFPLTIKSGSSAEIPVCFAPSIKGDFMDIISFNYNLDVPVQVTITGIGVVSELADLDYDFGKHRVGTSTKYEFVLRNLGIVDAIVKYYSIETNSVEFDISEFQAIDIVLHPNDEIRFNVDYNPKSIGIHQLKAYYYLDNDTNKKYSLTLRGEGTLPTIETEDHYLGEAAVFSSLDKIVTIVKAGGNEALSIESIKVLSGDIASFVFDLSTFQNVKLISGEQIDLSVRFAPQFVGKHIVNLEVVSDAAENFNKVRDTFKISADCHAVDTVTYSFTMKTPQEVLACSEYILEPKITNVGNVSIKLNSLIVEDASIGSGEWINQLINPIDIMPGDSNVFKYKITPKAHETGRIRFFAEVNGEMAKNPVEYQMNAITKRLILEPINDFSFHPGDTVKIKFAGRFPAKTVVPINPRLRIEVVENAFFLIPNNDTLMIEDNSKKSKIPLVLEQKNNYIDIPLSSNLILANSDALWQIDLEFQAYLANEASNPIRMYFESDECFDSVQDSLLTNLVGVCVYEYRTIKLLPNAPILKTNYNDLTDALDIEIENFTDEKYNFTLYNSSGQIVNSIPTLPLSKGVHLLSIDLSQLSDGLYILNVDGIRLKNNKIFIKNKK